MQASFVAPIGTSGLNQSSTFPKKPAKILGITQMVLGAVCVILQIILLAASTYLSQLSGGIWGGVFLIITGGITFGASQNGNKCLITASMVMSILTSLVCAFAVSFGVMAAIFNDDPDMAGNTLPLGNDTVIALNSVIAILAFINFFLVIVTAALDCRGVCCTGTYGQVTGVMHYVTMEGGQTVPVLVIDSGNTQASLPSSTQATGKYSPPPKYEEKRPI